ncbi:MAG: hypothetical protein FJ098_10915 [Deltaproteobacteria bacterium]|nr:hypothetical protein [Deltaproteobacteria bacterium]
MDLPRNLYWKTHEICVTEEAGRRLQELISSGQLTEFRRLKEEIFSGNIPGAFCIRCELALAEIAALEDYSLVTMGEGPRVICELRAMTDTTLRTTGLRGGDLVFPSGLI